MTLNIYHCETVTVRSEMIKRTKAGEVFYGLRVHMNTDQAVTFWARTQQELINLVISFESTVYDIPKESIALPGQLA